MDFIAARPKDPLRPRRLSRTNHIISHPAAARTGRHQVVMSIWFMAFTNTERLKGEFEQTMRLAGK